MMYGQHYSPEEEQAKFRGRRQESQHLFSVKRLRDDPDNQNWLYISVWYDMSESIIRQFKDYFDLDIIKMYQKLSEDFKKEMNIDKVI